MSLFSRLVSLVGNPGRALPADSTPLWRMWMASESLPTVVAGLELGVFSLLQKRSLTAAEIKAELVLTTRASKVLLWHLASLGLLEVDPASKRYSVTANFGDGWKRKISSAARAAVTPESYAAAVAKNSPLTNRTAFPAQNDPDFALATVLAERLSFPILVTAFDLGLFDLLRERAVTLDSISDTLSIPARYAKEILYYLHHYRLVKKDGGKWRTTSVGETYTIHDDKHPFNWSGILALIGENYPSPKSLLEAIRKDEEHNVDIENDPMMDHVLDDGLAHIFAKHMHSQGAAAAAALATLPAIKRARRLLDVAGGAGTYSLAFAKENSHIKATIMEVGPMQAIAQEWIRIQRLRSQVKIFEGNMFFGEEWPKEKFDTVFFSHVMHDWQENRIRVLLRNAHQVLEPGGRVILHEILVGKAGMRHDIATAFGVTLFKWTKGRQYKASELVRLLQSSGFAVDETSIVPGHGPSSLIIGTKPRVGEFKFR